MCPTRKARPCTTSTSPPRAATRRNLDHYTPSPAPTVLHHTVTQCPSNQYPGADRLPTPRRIECGRPLPARLHVRQQQLRPAGARHVRSRRLSAMLDGAAAGGSAYHERRHRGRPQRHRDRGRRGVHLGQVSLWPGALLYIRQFTTCFDNTHIVSPPFAHGPTAPPPSPHHRHHHHHHRHRRRHHRHHQSTD